eukprot:3405614-Pyramimonas_sp.AAC.1
MDPLGWALLPVFEPDSKYVASGAYHLPLFAGEVDADLLGELTDQSGPGVNALLRDRIETGVLKLTRSSVM